MNELIEAAKAVIERWDAHHVVVDGTLIADLRAAVDLAEKQEAVGFDEWWKDHGNGGYHDSLEAWTAAQQAERDRIMARFELSAQKIWPVGFPLNTGYVTSFDASLKAFLLVLLEDNQYDV